MCELNLIRIHTHISSLSFPFSILNSYIFHNSTFATLKNLGERRIVIMWKKGLPAHKPDSVLLPSFIWPFHYWKDLAAYPSRKHCCLWTSSSPHPPSPRLRRTKHDLHGISACKVYPRHTLLYEAVGFYPTFSPSPLLHGSYFLWHCLYHEAHATMTPALNRYIALCCPDFPLSAIWRKAMARPVACANLKEYLGRAVTVSRIVFIDERSHFSFWL